MKTIGITGGKGGTGKSTVAVLLANRFLAENKKVVLCDCDVECPNDYLLLGQRLKSPQKRVFAEFPKLNKAKCKKCGLCVKSCRSNAVFQAPGQYPVFIKDLCSGCGACWTICPHGAIERKKEEIGQIYLNEIRNKSEIQNSKFKTFYLITGMAKAGLEETGPVVAQTKKFALDFAKKIKADYILVDTAAGTHCPVIHALLNVDFAYCITEPTPMGARDLGLILDLCKKLKVPTKVILNQSDLGDKDKIYSVAEKFGVDVEKEIPYSKEIVKAYTKGRLLNFIQE